MAHHPTSDNKPTQLPADIEIKKCPTVVAYGAYRDSRAAKIRTSKSMRAPRKQNED